jgi:porphobilinogen synthase
MEKLFYPFTQRRVRADAHIRELTAGVKLSHKSFIQPLFVDEAITEPRLVNGLAGVYVETSETVLHTIEKSIAAGITKFLLFPVPAKKTTIVVF